MPPKYLEPGQLELLREELQREMDRLERSMRVTDAAAEPVALDQTTVGRLSRMDALQNQGLVKNLKEREQVRLGYLVSALERLEAGVYGVCTACGDAIPFQRLAVMPEAPTCAPCS